MGNWFSNLFSSKSESSTTSNTTSTSEDNKVVTEEGGITTSKDSVTYIQSGIDDNVVEIVSDVIQGSTGITNQALKNIEKNLEVQAQTQYTAQKTIENLAQIQEGEEKNIFSKNMPIIAFTLLGVSFLSFMFKK
jgi:hypothetical protein